MSSVQAPPYKQVRLNQKALLHSLTTLKIMSMHASFFTCGHHALMWFCVWIKNQMAENHEF